MTASGVMLPGGIVHLRCDNPGPMTLTGTNSYVVRAGAGHVVVIDPGPKDAAHCAALVAAVADAARVDGGGAGENAWRRTSVDVLLTHHHDDHEGGASDVVAALDSRGAAVRLWGGTSGTTLVDGALIGGVQVVLVPGHTADSAAFVWTSGTAAVVFSGDTVLGGSSSFIAYPDGDLTSYLLSLDVLASVLEPWPAAVLAPGHGDAAGSALPVITAYRAHREARLDEVRAVLGAERQAARNVDDDARVDAVINGVYAGLDPSLRPAIKAVVQAQLAHLDREARSARA